MTAAAPLTNQNQSLSAAALFARKARRHPEPSTKEKVKGSLFCFPPPFFARKARRHPEPSTKEKVKGSLPD